MLGLATTLHMFTVNPQSLSLSSWEITYTHPTPSIYIHPTHTPHTHLLVCFNCFLFEEQVDVISNLVHGHKCRRLIEPELLIGSCGDLYTALERRGGHGNAKLL